MAEKSDSFPRYAARAGMPHNEPGRELNREVRLDLENVNEILSAIRHIQSGNGNSAEKFVDLKPLIDELANREKKLRSAVESKGAKIDLKNLDDLSETLKVYQAYLERLQEQINGNVSIEDTKTTGRD